MRLTIVIPAAGSSFRMRGRDKLLEPVQGRPLLRLMARRAWATGAQVIVALPAQDHPLFAPRAKVLAGLDVRIVPVPDADQGMSRSLVAALGAADPSLPVMILPADMPELETADLRAVIHAGDDIGNDVPNDTILRGAAADGTPGHPVIFPASDRPALLSLGGDKGARDLLAKALPRTRLVLLPLDHALVDLDTPEEWEAWREGQHIP